MAQQGMSFATFFPHFCVKSKISHDTSLLEDTKWILDLAFLTDITGKLNHLSCELQGKGKTVADMISTINAFKAKMNIFSVHLQQKSAFLEQVL